MIVTLGRTGIQAEKNGFGALPVQRVTKAEAVEILRCAADGGMNYFDTARFYTDSEEKLGEAFEGTRHNIFLATKTHSKNVMDFWDHLHTSLKLLKTDYIDVYQFHNPEVCYKPGDGTGMYEAMLEAKAQGKIRFIGFTNHRRHLAIEAVESGLYDLLQYPFSYLSAEEDVEVSRLCREKQVGFVGMKGLSGGLITNSMAACAFISQFDNVVPIWGVQRMHELMEFLFYIKTPPELTPELWDCIEKDRAQLAGDYCRGCGYCLPCPADIDIPTAARMSLLLRRAPVAGYLSEAGQQAMKRIDDCINCLHCVNHCPYGLDTPKLLRANYEDYKTLIK